MGRGKSAVCELTMLAHSLSATLACHMSYQSQQTSLASSARSYQQESRELLRGSLPVEVEVDEKRRDQADQQGDEDGGDGR